MKPSVGQYCKASARKKWAYGGLILLVSVIVDASPRPACRDRFLEPFSSDSIWNTAIGSKATFTPASLYTAGREPSQIHNDQDFFLRVPAGEDSDFPLTDWVDQGDWGADDHCAVKPSSKVIARISFPRNWTSASDCNDPTDTATCRSAAGQPNNNAMAVLLADNVTIVQMQPAYRCGAYPSPLLARYGNATDGCPQQFPNTTSILGGGALGAHGGSGLSAVGGSIRLGELLEGTGPIRHALKLELQHQWYYGKAKLQPNTAENGGRAQYVWPATGSDSGSNKAPGGLYTGSNPHVAPGALLAIPASLADAVKVMTVPGKKIKQALVDYGGYLVDDTGAGNSAAICMEAPVNAEMRAHFGYTMTYPHGVSNASTDPGRPLYQDLLAIFRALHAVTNNGPSSVGGGGTPRVPEKEPLCE